MINIYLVLDEEEEWVDIIKVKYVVNIGVEIDFDDLLGFWLIPIYIPNTLLVPNPSIEHNKVR